MNPSICYAKATKKETDHYCHAPANQQSLREIREHYERGSIRSHILLLQSPRITEPAQESIKRDEECAREETHRRRSSVPEREPRLPAPPASWTPWPPPPSTRSESATPLNLPSNPSLAFPRARRARGMAEKEAGGGGGFVGVGFRGISPTVGILLMETGVGMALGSMIDGQDCLLRIF